MLRIFKKVGRSDEEEGAMRKKEQRGGRSDEEEGVTRRKEQRGGRIGGEKCHRGSRIGALERRSCCWIGSIECCYCRWIGGQLCGSCRLVGVQWSHSFWKEMPDSIYTIAVMEWMLALSRMSDRGMWFVVSIGHKVLRHNNSELTMKLGYSQRRGWMFVAMCKVYCGDKSYSQWKLCQ